jgi:hypothetical protein
MYLFSEPQQVMALKEDGVTGEGPCFKSRTRQSKRGEDKVYLAGYISRVLIALIHTFIQATFFGYVIAIIRPT